MYARSAHAQKVSSNRWGLLALAGIFALSGCALFKGDHGAAADAYDPQQGGAGEAETYDDATEAILATRSEPESEKVRELESLFKAGDYAASLLAAQALLGGVEVGDEEIDSAVFVEGASLYYLGRHSEAQAPLDRHRREFPESRYAESSQYYGGSNQVKQRRWRAGGLAIDAFMARYPESLLMEFALYDRASAHYALGEYDRCFVFAERIQSEFIYSKIIDRAGVLKGDVLKKKGQFPQAEAAFLAAKNSAESFSHRNVAARALRSLIEVSAEQGRWEDSADYYRAFFRKYGSSSQAAPAALAGLPVMKKLGDLDPGLDRLEGVLMAMPEGTSPRVFNTALGAYADYFGDLHGPGALMQRFGNLHSSGRGSERLRQQLIVARLEVLETHFPERTAEINVFYDEIRTRSKREDLAIPTLLKIGKHVAKSDLGEGAFWYRAALARPGSEYKAEATFGLAKVLAASSDPQVMAEAARGFKMVLDSYGSPTLEEESVLGLARLAVRMERWAEARDYWAHYVRNANWQLARREAEEGFNVAVQRAGAKVEQAPAVRPPTKRQPAAKPLPQQSATATVDIYKLRMKVKQAERLASAGMKAQAYEVLKKVLVDGATIDEPDEATAKALRAAGILKENLELELGRE